MNKGVYVDEPSSARLRVGAELRRIREVAGLSGEYVARTLGWSQSKVSRIETGRHAIVARDVAALLVFYGAPDDVRAELLAATATDNGEGAWIQRAGGFVRRQESMAQMESVTSLIRHFQPVLVPGLLQTHDYAKDVAAAAGAKDPLAIADRRMERQEILKAAGAPGYSVVLDARALLCRFGEVSVIHDQIDYLADSVPQLRTVDLRVLPLLYQWPVSPAVAFMMYEFTHADSTPVVYVEAPAGDSYFSEPSDVERHLALFNQLRAVALPQDASIGYLKSLHTEVTRYTS
jgi:transcriptional regulator with XRE-family HTH domain